MTLSEQKAKRAARAQRRKDNAAFQAKIAGKPKRVSLKKLEAARWKAFSEFIRARDPWCFDCADMKKADNAGHIISRRKRATKYHPLNVFGQASFCNWSDKVRPGYHDHCVSVYISRFGAPAYIGLVELSNKEHKEDRGTIIADTELYVQAKKEIEAGLFGHAQHEIYSRANVPLEIAVKLSQNYSYPKELNP